MVLASTLLQLWQRHIENAQSLICIIDPWTSAQNITVPDTTMYYQNLALSSGQGHCNATNTGQAKGALKKRPPTSPPAVLKTTVANVKTSNAKWTRKGQFKVEAPTVTEFVQNQGISVHLPTELKSRRIPRSHQVAAMPTGDLGKWPVYLNWIYIYIWIHMNLFHNIS